MKKFAAAVLLAAICVSPAFAGKRHYAQAPAPYYGPQQAAYAPAPVCAQPCAQPCGQPSCSPCINPLSIVSGVVNGVGSLISNVIGGVAGTFGCDPCY